MERITFETTDGLTLEGEVRLPEPAPARGAAVICHAHPRHGGSKDHPVLWALRIELAHRRFAVLAFNFRGVMGSGGTFGGGLDEVEDVRAAVGRIRAEALGPLIVCGWSFGAHVALRTAMDDERIDALAMLGFPVSDEGPRLPPLPDHSELAGFRRPALFVSGERDPYSPVPDLRALARRIPLAAVAVVKGTDHYFGKRERDAARLVGAFAGRILAGDPRT